MSSWPSRTRSPRCTIGRSPWWPNVEEIEDRIKQNDVKFFTVVGTLRTSSLQRGSTMLYRLTDPSTGRTVTYLHTNDPKYTAMLGQFIGVHGTLTTEPALNMKVVDDPTSAEAVDPAKVNGAVAAQVIPPSLMPRSPQANAGTTNAQYVLVRSRSLARELPPPARRC